MIEISARELIDWNRRESDTGDKRYGVLLTERVQRWGGRRVMTFNRKSDPCRPDSAACQTPSTINAMNRRWDKLCPQFTECEIYIANSPLAAVSKDKLFSIFRQERNFYHN